MPLSCCVLALQRLSRASGAGLFGDAPFCADGMDDCDDDWDESDEDADAGVADGQAAGHAAKLSAAHRQHARRALLSYKHRGVPLAVVHELATVLFLDSATRAAFAAWFVKKEAARTGRAAEGGILCSIPTPHDAVGTCGRCRKWRIVSEAIERRCKNSARSLGSFLCGDVIGENGTPFTCDMPSQFETDEAAAEWLEKLLEGRKQAAQLMPGYKPRGTQAYRREQAAAAARRPPERIGQLPGMQHLAQDLEAFFAPNPARRELESAAHAGGTAPGGDADMVDAPAARDSRAPRSRAPRSRAPAGGGGGAAGEDSAAAAAATTASAPAAGAAAGAGAEQRGANGGRGQKTKRVRKLWEPSDAVAVMQTGEELGLFSARVTGRVVLAAMKDAGTVTGDVTAARATTLLKNHCTTVGCVSLSMCLPRNA